MARVHLGFGGNLGAVEENLREALAQLCRLPGTSALRLSSLYRTAPVGTLEQADFLNGAAAVDTQLQPEPLLRALLGIERGLGRVRGVRWGPRTVDLDLLLWEDRVIRTPGLTVPHPRLHERGFVLVPLVEIAPAVVHPLLGRTLRDLLADLGPVEGVRREGRPPWLQDLERMCP